MKKILIIGSSSKIAQEFIKAYKNNYHIYSTYRSDTAIKDTEVTYTYLDLSDKNSVARFIEQEKNKAFSGVFVFASTYEPDHSNTENYFTNAERDITVNVMSPMIILKKLNYEQDATVFLFGDSGTEKPKPNYTSYSISKEVLRAFCKILAVELADSARVILIRLGPTLAPPTTNPDEYYGKSLRKVSSPTEGLIKYCNFILNEKNFSMTGADITYDGGAYLRRETLLATDHL
jgi:short-subunit dehydrogenase